MVEVPEGASENIVTYCKIDLNLNWSKLDLDIIIIDEIFEENKNAKINKSIDSVLSDSEIQKISNFLLT